LSQERNVSEIYPGQISTHPDTVKVKEYLWHWDQS